MRKAHRDGPDQRKDRNREEASSYKARIAWALRSIVTKKHGDKIFVIVRIVPVAGMLIST